MDAGTVQAYRGAMAQAYADFTRKHAQGETNIQPGATAPSTRGRRDLAPKGGIVLSTRDVMPFYLADYWDSGNVDHIVPMESLRSTPSVNQLALEVVSAGYPDQEAMAAFSGAGVPSKDKRSRAKLVLSTNHQAAVNHHPFVDNMFMGEVREGQMFRFDAHHSPPVAPSYVTPVGAVTKSTRDGQVDPEVMRPTADLSWPPVGYWMELLVSSPNASVDLKRDFPYIYMVSAHDLIDQILFLRYRASPSGLQSVR